MGRVITAVGRVLAARVVLLRADANDDGKIDPSAFDGEIVTIAPGIREFRRDDERLFVVQKIVAATVNTSRYVLVVVWAPALTRDSQSVFAGIAADLDVEIVRKADGSLATWPTLLHADGSLRVPALDADASALATQVKAVWPAWWRVRLATDAVDAPPTGARCLALVMA
jgi:hypothetical protein